MAKPKTGHFTVSYPWGATANFEKSGITIGRLASSEIVFDAKTVSRVHAGLNYIKDKYHLTNLSTSNVLTLNGRLLAAQNSDVLANGDIIQIGPFVMSVELENHGLKLDVKEQVMAEYRSSAPKTVETFVSLENIPADVLTVFWEKRSREKESVGTRLRPVGKPEPGKAIIKWKPTGDLRRPWRTGLFIWIFLIFGVFAVLAFWRYPDSFAAKPLASPHIRKIDSSLIAARANENSCTTCHMPDQPVDTACITCHQAEGFHASNTKAHEEAGITCTACHTEHKGEDFPMRDEARQTCANCHNDNNKRTYNGKAVQTAHGGSFGYPAAGGKWLWKGLYSEIADTIPAIGAARVKDETEQAVLSRQFHAMHIGRLQPPPGMKADGRGRVSCSTCHTSFDPVDRETPRQTCASCHNNAPDTAGSPVNCISCHVQHPFSSRRWDAFLTPEAKNARKTVVDAQIKRLNEKK